MRVVRWLLQRGAHASLHVRNAMGKTPIELAQEFGPHPEVQKQLAAAALNSGLANRNSSHEGRRRSSLVSGVIGVGSRKRKGTRGGKVQPDLRQARAGETAASLDYQMYVMSLQNYLSVSKLTTHEELVEAGVLVPWSPTMRCVMFVSQEWTSFEHPDHSHDQSRTLKTLLIRMLRGQCPTTSPNLASVHLPSDVRISSQEWQHLVSDAYVWIDYISMPQLNGSHTAEARRQRERALKSMPAYVERCSHFLVVCPAVEHRERHKVCDLSSYFQSGQCRTQMMALMLARHSHVPAIIVKGGAAAP